MTDITSFVAGAEFDLTDDVFSAHVLMSETGRVSARYDIEGFWSGDCISVTFDRNYLSFDPENPETEWKADMTRSSGGHEGDYDEIKANINFAKALEHAANLAMFLRDNEAHFEAIFQEYKTRVDALRKAEKEAHDKMVEENRESFGLTYRHMEKKEVNKYLNTIYYAADEGDQEEVLEVVNKRSFVVRDVDFGVTKVNNRRRYVVEGQQYTWDKLVAYFIENVVVRIELD